MCRISFIFYWIHVADFELSSRQKCSDCSFFILIFSFIVVVKKQIIETDNRVLVLLSMPESNFIVKDDLENGKHIIALFNCIIKKLLYSLVSVPRCMLRSEKI